ncbi:nicotinamide riboside transporter PnuC [Adhaeribacter radiodurans]|uniref:Nicotinamide riboside transporter PnuC n=1 Tax=Adhaeribacter radiodurans TaxID=2745197 RepID=A0A7L7LAX9_9BACT|nr:nicotinamide riboside transporter PnuC [Adhaeribacter radiodurans]QMU29992.1 nicotinamide mononucleotide transporter [Adhaeribacter radiodurans]
MTLYEIIGTVTGVAGVWLAARENIWTWPVGMVSTLMLIYVCFDARLYADVGLNIFYFITSAYGWYAWLHPDPDSVQTEIPVTRTQPLQWLWLSVFSVVFTLGLGFFLTHFTNADLSYTDSATTGVSLAAYWMMARKKLENWLVWLVVDSAYVGIYLYKELYMLAGLYFVFLILATDGYIKWRRAIRVTQPA